MRVRCRRPLPAPVGGAIAARVFDVPPRSMKLTDLENTLR